MRIFHDGGKVGKGFVSCYLKNCAYVKRKGLEKRITLHKLYQHLVESNGLELRVKAEERETNNYSKQSKKMSES